MKVLKRLDLSTGIGAFSVLAIVAVCLIVSSVEDGVCLDQISLSTKNKVQDRAKCYGVDEGWGAFQS
jgi:hypothetical protein